MISSLISLPREELIKLSPILRPHEKKEPFPFFLERDNLIIINI